MFNPNEHFMQIKCKNGTVDYLEVKWRLVWFRQACPEGTIATELVLLDLDRETQDEVSVWNNEKRRSEKITKVAQGLAVFRATVTDGKGNSATGTKMEKAAAFPDFLEKAETGAVGRALAMLGYGTQFTGDELAEHHRIVDSPVPSRAPSSANTSTPPPSEQDANSPATEQQLSGIINLCKKLGTDVPEQPMSRKTAALLIKKLNEQAQQPSKAS
jgi:hypothetical protein